MALQKIPGRAIKLGTDTAGDVAYFDGAAWQRLAIGTAGQALTMNEAGTLPTWGNVWKFQGDYYGYAVMGFNATPVGPINAVDKYSFASDTDAVDHCDTFAVGSHLSCSRSATHGYANAGEVYPSPQHTNRITKFSFASSVTGTDVADLLQASGTNTGNSSGTYGYVCGGAAGANNPIVAQTNVIQKYSVTTDANATDVGDLTLGKRGSGEANSITHGYTMGGAAGQSGIPEAPLTSSDVIEKFSFATDGNATDIANMTDHRYMLAGCSSTTHGYSIGGHATSGPVGYRDIIDKFSFATEADSIDVGNLIAVNGLCAGSSSTTHGYNHGGYPDYLDRIEKISFTTDGDATDIANLAVRRDNSGGVQN